MSAVIMLDGAPAPTPLFSGRASNRRPSPDAASAFSHHSPEERMDPEPTPTDVPQPEVSALGEQLSAAHSGRSVRRIADLESQAAKQQTVYADLLDVFRKSAFYQQFIPFSVDMLQSHAERMTFTTLYELEPNINPIGLRQMWVDGLRSDSERKSISMEHHGSKVVLH
jgi:hypothetical protein